MGTNKGIEVYPILETGVDVFEYGDVVYIEGGVTGPKGDPGIQGEIGPAGPQGNPGVDGVMVPLGTPFDTSNAAAPSYVLQNEIDYLSSSTSDVAYAHNLLTKNVSAIVDVLQHAEGVSQMRGAAVFTGTGPPPPHIEDAVPGDVYLDTTTGSNRIYVLEA